MVCEGSVESRKKKWEVYISMAGNCVLFLVLRETYKGHELFLNCF